MKMPRIWALLVVGLALFGWSVVDTELGLSDAVLPAPVILASQQPDPFVGNEMCVRCHADVQDALESVPHGAGVPAASALVDDGCQNCHGPGRLHVQFPEDTQRHPAVTRMPFEQQTELCVSCHTDQPAFDETHTVAQTSCSSCHILHQRQTPTPATLAWQPNCLSCHLESSGFNELHAYDMDAMRAGNISCTSCHVQVHAE